MATQFLETFENIKSKHDSVLKMLDVAICSEENQDISIAFESYKKCITLIDQTLATPVSLPENTESVKNEWNEACKIIHKLKRTRADALRKIGILSGKLNSLDDKEKDWSNALSNGNGRPRTYTELAEALRNMQYNLCLINSLELIFWCSGVQLYHIEPNGIVTSILRDSKMRIIRMEKDEEKCLKETFFIQIIKSSRAVSMEQLEFKNEETRNAIENSEENQNLLQDCCSSVNSQSVDNFDAQNGSSWIYPLIPGVSPCFRTDYGAFIFPDLESLEQETSFGVIVPKDDKNDEVVLEILEAILHGVVIQAKEDQIKEPLEMNQEISENIVRGAQFISQNIIKGAEKTGRLISYTTPFLISKMKGTSTEISPVCENMQTTMKVAKNITKTAAGATGYIAGKIGSATIALGRFLAPHIEKQGSTLISKGLGLSEQEAQKKVTEVLTIAASAVEGFGTIYMGLEESAKILGKSLGENSVKIIEHKYGPSAGNLAAGTFDTVGNVINLSQNVSYFTSKGFAKKAAKNTGKAIIENYHRRDKTERTVPASSLYPEIYPDSNLK